jgi:hypothetical protein
VKYPNSNQKFEKIRHICCLALPAKARILCLDSFIEYSSFKGFWPLGNNDKSIFYMRIFERCYFGSY